MNAVELIIKKRSGYGLSKEELTYFLSSYLEGNIPEYQMSAMLMAIFFQDMKDTEIQTLTELYIKSGEHLSFPKEFKTVDKHSTGGVGDKITVMLAPIATACGAKIPMISGRGLGHTGGTLDKLESIPGLRTNFTANEFKNIIEKVGFSIISQSNKMVPADKRIYALRDVTGTVESLPLITASIMSKKIAEGAQNLVIDLKIGTGAFIKNLEDGKRLANLLKNTGKNLGQNVSVVFTNMNSPLGYSIGNALEIKESINYLKGENIPDIDAITKELVSQMLIMTDNATDKNDAISKINEVINNGKALEYFEKFIEAQNGNPKVCSDISLLPTSKYKIPIISKKNGYISSINSQQIGYTLIEIGAGRKSLDTKLDYSAGAELFKKVGDKISKEEIIGYLHTNLTYNTDNVISRLLNSYEITDEKVDKENLILNIK
jgi:pyrimidine-nucleoside phosphorylase